VPRYRLLLRGSRTIFQAGVVVSPFRVPISSQSTPALLENHTWSSPRTLRTT
jgi:hypothetical protein